jgi:hypothetical protein
MRIRCVPLSLVYFVTISLLLHHARAADTTIQKELREFLGNLYVKAEKAASIADFIPLVAFPSDFPNDYPEVGAKVIAQQFGKQLLEWARDTQSKQKTHLYKVETLRTVEAHGLALQVALVLETEKATQKTRKMETYWLKNAANKWKFFGLESLK